MAWCTSSPHTALSLNVLHSLLGKDHPKEGGLDTWVKDVVLWEQRTDYCRAVT